MKALQVCHQNLKNYTTPWARDYNMRWAVPARGDIRRVVDKSHLYNRIINNNRIILDGHGTPVTYWRNTSINEIGQSPKITHGAIKCYCWDTNQAQPDKKHVVCQGTGWLTHTYQKYGYQDLVFSTPSPLFKSTADLVIDGDRNSQYSLSGISTVGTLTTERLPLINFKDVTYILINDESDSTHNRIEYSYTLDDIHWVPMIVEACTAPVCNKVSYIIIPQDATFIRFAIMLRKRSASSPSPSWNYIRFRYRQLLNFGDIDPRFPIPFPAFLSSRNNPQEQIEQGEFGWITSKPYRWWSLPEAKIEENDIIMFLQGSFSGQRSVVKNIVKYTYGPLLQITHREYETKFIRDDDDLLGVAELLM